MSTDKSNPYFVRVLSRIVACCVLILAVCLYPYVAENYLYKPTTHDVFDAARRGTVKDVRYFIRHGATVNDKDSADGTPQIHYAARYNLNIEVLKYLVENGADVYAKDKFDQTPLHYMLLPPNSNNADVLKYLIEQGANVNAKDKFGLTPLHIAAKFSLFNDIEIAKILIDNGADVNAKDDDDKTPLDYAYLDYAYNKEEEAILREAGGKRGEELPE